MIKKLLLEDYDGDEYHSGGTSIICPYCNSTIFDLEDYIRCYTPLDAEFEYSRGDHLERIMENEFYIPKDYYNQDIEFCHCCGKKLQWKYLYLDLLKNRLKIRGFKL